MLMSTELTKLLVTAIETGQLDGLNVTSEGDQISVLVKVNFSRTPATPEVQGLSPETTCDANFNVTPVKVVGPNGANAESAESASPSS